VVIGKKLIVDCQKINTSKRMAAIISVMLFLNVDILVRTNAVIVLESFSMETVNKFATE